MRRLHKPEFKAKVALAAIKGEMTMAEMVRKFDVQQTQISQWKQQLLANASGAFDKIEKAADDAEKTVQGLHAKIGQLTMENGEMDSRYDTFDLRMKFDLYQFEGFQHATDYRCRSR